MREQIQTTRQRQLRTTRTRLSLGIAANHPRLSVFRSNRAVYTQIIDASGRVIAAANSLKMKAKHKTDAAIQVGEAIAKAAQAAGINQVVFDRGAYRYHGRVKALAESAREHGLKF